MIGRDKFIKAHRPQLHLPTLGRAQPRQTTARALRRGMLGKLVEQRSIHGAHHTWRKIAMKLPHLVTPRRYFPASPEARETFTGSEYIPGLSIRSNRTERLKDPVHF